MAANIKAMMETLQKMEEMQKEVNADVNKDINQKRHEALKKIYAYLDDIADSLDGRQMHVEFKDNQIFGQFRKFQDINFNSKYVTKKGDAFSSTKYSEEPIKWWIGCIDSIKYSNDDYWYYIDSEVETSTSKDPSHWAPGFINLIEEWPNIKVVIESEIQRQLTEQMERIRKETSNRIASYEKVNEFEA